MVKIIMMKENSKRYDDNDGSNDDEKQERVHFFIFGDKYKPSEQEKNITIEDAGFKAFNLIRMSRIGLPVPPGFVLGTQLCRTYLEKSENNRDIPNSVRIQIQESIKLLEQLTGQNFAGQRKPLLVSVRSGAAISMPGMMDTILNIGLCDSTTSGLLRMTGNTRFVWDSYRRLIQNFAEIVHGCSPDIFDGILEKRIFSEKATYTSQLDSLVLKELVGEYLDAYEEKVGSPFPQQPIVQLTYAIEAVFKSWESPRATEYRKMHNIKGVSGTAVTVQTMVFGNMGSTSGSGVAFTRDPSTGANRLYMDFLFNSQGEDIVAGRTQTSGLERLGTLLPEVLQQIQSLRTRLELEFKDMQDFEFAVQERKLFLLQTRTGKRTPWAALQIIVDMVNEGIIDKKTGIERLKKYDLDAIKRIRFVSSSDDVIRNTSISSAISANQGIASGEIVFDSETAQEKAKLGSPVILVREDISPNDIAGIAVASGILTKLGGKTSHAAVVAREIDKVCIVGCNVLMIDFQNRSCKIGEKKLNEGDYITLDGNSGKIYDKKLEVVTERPEKLLSQISEWKKEM